MESVCVLERSSRHCGTPNGALGPDVTGKACPPVVECGAGIGRNHRRGSSPRYAFMFSRVPLLYWEVKWGAKRRMRQSTTRSICVSPERSVWNWLQRRGTVCV